MTKETFICKCSAMAHNYGQDCTQGTCCPHYYWQGKDWSLIVYTNNIGTEASMSIRMPWNVIGQRANCDFETAINIIENIVK